MKFLISEKNLDALTDHSKKIKYYCQKMYTNLDALIYLCKKMYTNLMP